VNIVSVVRRQAEWCSSARGLAALLSPQRVLLLRVTFARCILGKLWGLAKGAFAFSEVQVAAKCTQTLSANRLSRNNSRGNDVQGRLIVRRPHEYTRKLRFIASEPW
jgi:hypothetical protein